MGVARFACDDLVFHGEVGEEDAPLWGTSTSVRGERSRVAYKPKGDAHRM